MQPSGFELAVSIGSGEAPLLHSIDADDERQAILAAKAIIAQACGAPDAFVHLGETGRFSVGAGFRTRTGRYSLRRQTDPR
jgi:hypothetical protein